MSNAARQFLAGTGIQTTEPANVGRYGAIATLVASIDPTAASHQAFADPSTLVSRIARAWLADHPADAWVHESSAHTDYGSRRRVDFSPELGALRSYLDAQETALFGVSPERATIDNAGTFEAAAKSAVQDAELSLMREKGAVVGAAMLARLAAARVASSATQAERQAIEAGLRAAGRNRLLGSGAAHLGAIKAQQVNATIGTISGGNAPAPKWPLYAAGAAAVALGLAAAFR
jgi:hypothetical protein